MYLTEVKQEFFLIFLTLFSWVIQKKALPLHSEKFKNTLFQEGRNIISVKQSVRQVVKSSPFHGGVTGSNPVRTTKSNSEST